MAQQHGPFEYFNSLPKMNWQEYITAGPAVLVGKPVIRGTQLAIAFILGLMAQR
jgi:uncharacterized protein (DUF433 family)